MSPAMMPQPPRAPTRNLATTYDFTLDPDHGRPPIAAGLFVSVNPPCHAAWQGDRMLTIGRRLQGCRSDCNWRSRVQATRTAGSRCFCHETVRLADWNEAPRR